MQEHRTTLTVYGRRGPAVAWPGRTRPAFSLVDLLVSISVMAILMTLLAPALQSSLESARRTRCGIHLRQIALGVQMYGDDFMGRMPSAVFGLRGGHGSSSHAHASSNTSNNNSWSGDTIHLRLSYDQLQALNQTRPSHSGSWDGLGVLFTDQYLTNPQVFYCPSHNGDHYFRSYTDNWTGSQGRITANYQYRVPSVSHFLHELSPFTNILADGLASKSDYNHIVGNNFAQADLSLGWYSDERGELYRVLPERTPIFPAIPTTQGGGAWDILDKVTTPVGHN